VIDRIVVWALRLKSERGQDIMEYAILTGGIAVALLVALAIFAGTGTGAGIVGTPLGDFFDRLGKFMDDLVPTT
jgi:Flp pilus assembly pilin Flp